MNARLSVVDFSDNQLAVILSDENEVFQIRALSQNNKTMTIEAINITKLNSDNSRLPYVQVRGVATDNQTK